MGKNTGRGRRTNRARSRGPVGQGQATPPASGPTAPSAPAPAPTNAAPRLHEDDDAQALFDEIRQLASESESLLTTRDEPNSDTTELERVWAVFRALARRQAEAVDALTAHEERIRAERSALRADATERADEAAALREEHDLLDARATLLDRREAELEARQQKAELRSTERRLEVARELEVWVADHRRKAVEALEAEHDAWRTRWAETQQRLSDAQGAMDQRESDFAQRERDLRSQQSRLKMDEEDMAHLRKVLKEQQTSREERFERQIDARTTQLAQSAEEDRRRVQVLTEANERLNARLSEQEGSLAVLGGQTPDRIAERIARLQAENARLTEEMATSPRVDAQMLVRLQEQVRQLSVDNEELVRERGELESSLQRDRIAVNERQNYLDLNNYLQAANSQIRQTLDEEAAKLNATAEAGKKGLAFPACSRMDLDFGTPQPSVTHPPQLGDLVDQMQAVILQHGRLAYRRSDLRLVLAGMAMSRLHLFQGISGIGKTGLGRALATAFGSAGSVAVVPVQAGWRDPQDLMGYYNSFDRMFYESEFTKALYRAQCPQFRDRPFFIVLDEMNLSHPEQYFSGVLSALAIKEGPRLALTTAPVRNPPHLLIDGTHISVPDNVWFIGTANHDETTVGFADKTYDRAFVLELPWQHPELSDDTTGLPDPLGHRALMGAFDEARSRYAQQATAVIDFLDIGWRGRFAEDLGIGWGNRLEQQIKDFAPVVIAAGGSLGEAVDHVLATRVLRSVGGRYDIHADTLDGLRADLVESLREFDGAHDPVATDRLLNSAIRSRGRR
ncbi:hypothetical protein [Streptomyces sp. NBC_00690]|uniref:hypothetical protein n=1 Tax=Streptomyces sp. NBC_00690 TaxID=2975808 RepID=UPI002E27F81C|nr:hypothetical protein [Streptomyces sp. NBC_00690]